jgi:uncharacterized protein
MVLRPDEGEWAPPARPRKPKTVSPGFWESVGWCVVFLCGQIFALTGVTIVVFVIFIFQAKDPQQFADAQMKALEETNKSGEKNHTPAPKELATSIAWGMVAAPFVSLGMIAIILPWRIGRGWKRQIGVRRPRLVHLLLVVLVLPGFIVAPDAIQAAFQWITGLKPDSSAMALKDIFTGFPWALTALAVAIGPGVVEEFWCRGFLGRGLCARFGSIIGVLLTSMMFAAMHLDIKQFLIFTFMGACLHFVYFATRCIWVPILLHAMNNGAAILLALTLSPEQVDQTTPVSLWVGAFSLLACGGIALWTSRPKDEPVLREDEAWYEPDGWKPEYPGISAPPKDVNLRLTPKSPNAIAMVLTLIASGVMVYLFYTFLK